MLLLFHFYLQYSCRKVHENQVGQKLNWTHQIRVYADVNFLRDNKDAINRNLELIRKLVQK
jgi:hypothetical protein